MFLPPIAKTKSSHVRGVSPPAHRPERAKPRQESSRPEVARDSHSASWSFGKVSVFPSDGTRASAGSAVAPARHATGPIQTKLKVSRSHDPLEKEADVVADRVLQQSSSREKSKETPRISRADGVSHGRVSREGTPAGSKAADSVAPNLVHDMVKKSGQPLDAGTREYFEPRIGHDLSGVRVHADASAAQSAQSIQANAYTSGHSIVFSDGKYAPETHDGKRLLAHELTHVVQQAGAKDESVAPAANEGSGTPSESSSGLVQRDSSTPFVQAKDFVSQHLPMLMAENYEPVARDLYMNFVFQGLDYHYVIKVFNDIKSKDEDNVAALFAESLAKNSLLDICAAHPLGRTMLNVLYEAMITGDVSEFERKQAQLILDAKTQRMKPEDFIKSTQVDSKSRATQVFPVRNMRVTPGYDDAPLEAELVAKNTKVRVKYPARIRGTKMFAQDFATLQGDPFSTEGVELPAGQIIGIRDYETNGGKVDYVPALALIDYSNRVKHSTLGTIAQVSMAAASVGLAGPAFAGEEAAEATAGETAVGAGGKWAARLATADRVAGYVQVVSFFVGENRQFLIDKFGWAGKLLVKASEVADSAVAIYGIGRLAHGGFQIAKDLRNASKACREQAASMLDLSKEEMQALEKIDRETDELIKELEGAKAPEAGGGAVAPKPATAGDPVPATSAPRKVEPQAATAPHQAAAHQSAPHPAAKPQKAGRTSRSAEFEAKGPHPFGKKAPANTNRIPPAESHVAEKPLAATGTGEVAPVGGTGPHEAHTSPHSSEGAGGTRMAGRGGNTGGPPRRGSVSTRNAPPTPGTMPGTQIRPPSFATARQQARLERAVERAEHLTRGGSVNVANLNAELKSLKSPAELENAIKEVESSVEKKASTEMSRVEKTRTAPEKRVDKGHSIQEAERKWTREEVLGETPGKTSKTGREVQARMRKDNLLRGEPGNEEFFDSRTKEWYPVNGPKTHMGHTKDAVTWWNTKGKYYARKSPEVRAWMKYSENYALEYGPANSAAGGALLDEYVGPHPDPIVTSGWENPPGPDD